MTTIEELARRARCPGRPAGCGGTGLARMIGDVVLATCTRCGGAGVLDEPSAATVAPGDMRSPDILEAPIQAECLRLLEEDGWRTLVTTPVSRRAWGTGFGEIGMADALAIRYRYFGNLQLGSACSEVLWLEFKRPRGGVVSKHQQEWHTKERARGALTAIASVDFPATVEGFKSWYRASGLNRGGV